MLLPPSAFSASLKALESRRTRWFKAVLSLVAFKSFLVMEEGRAMDILSEDFFPTAYASRVRFATSLQMGFPSAENFVSYSVMTFPSAMGLWCRSRVDAVISQPACGIASRE